MNSLIDLIDPAQQDLQEKSHRSNDQWLHSKKNGVLPSMPLFVP